MPSVEKLKQRLSLTLKARRFDAALSALVALAREEPNEPSWPRRAARLFHARADRKGEVAALRRALSLQIDQGLVLDAIATCQALLEVLPDDERTLQTLDLLYLEGPTGPDVPRPSAARPAAVSSSLGGMRGHDADAPLEDLVLTDVVPGARAVAIGDGEPGSVVEIPLDGPEGSASGVDAPLDLRLDRWSSSADLRDVAAAQALCLPRREVAAGPPRTGDRAASLRSELANVPLFGELDPGSLHTLIRRVRVVMLAAGQVLFRQGDAANSLYVVVDGAVVPIAEGERRRKLAVLERGEFFGEIGLLGRRPRNATIEALVDTKLLAIDRRLIWELIEAEPGVARCLMRFLRDRLVDRQMRTNPFFSAFAHAARDAVVRQFRFLEVEPGTRVVEAGKAPEGLFVVLSGDLALVDRDPADGVGKEIGGLGLGDVFGGLSLIEGRLPEADVVARGKCWLVVMGEGRFRRILEANPRLDRVLRRIAKTPEVAREGAARPL